MNLESLERDFMESWDETESWFRSIADQAADPSTPGEASRKAMHHGMLLEVGLLIQAMRSAAYDRTLRAGVSALAITMILSRSRVYGLRREQPRIQFWFREGDMKVLARLEKDEGELEIDSPQIELTPDVVRLLDMLQ